MFIGHPAVAFAAKRTAPRTSLGTLVMAAIFLDLVWPLFLILGIEHVRIRGGTNPFLVLDFYDYPWTHSIVAALGWSVLFAIVYFGVTRYARGALVSGALVFSHWILDFFTHIPDLPLVPHGATAGLGLWRSVPGTIGVEVTLFAIGVALYVRSTKSRDRIGVGALIGLVAMLLVIYTANLGPPPPNTKVIGYAGLAQWLFPLWAWWIDRHRDVRT